MTEPAKPAPPARSARRLWWGLAAVLLALPVTLYALLFWRWHSVQPEVTFDYLAELNAPALAVPESDRAWPMLREAWAAGGIHGLDVPLRTEDGGWDVESPAASLGFGGGFDSPAREPVDPAEWVRTHHELVGAGRRAADFAGFGWLAGRRDLPEAELAVLHGGVDPREDADVPTDPVDLLVEDWAVMVVIPTLRPLRNQGRILALDAHVAAEAGDGARWLADLAGIEAAAHFADETPTLFSGLVCLSLLALHNGTVEETVLANPGRVDDMTLAEVAARLAKQEIRGVLNVGDERQAMRDTLQRTHGPDGRLNATGWEVLQRFSGGWKSDDGWRARGQRLANPLRLLVAASREQEMAVHDAYLEAWNAWLREPAREASGPTPKVGAGFAGWRFAIRHPVLAALAVSMTSFPNVQENVLARRDAARLAVALARFRLAHAAWPAALDELVPAFLEELPADRITGGPLRYTVRGERPAVWSLGADRDDDGGVPAADGPDAAALWGDNAASPPDGDWLLLGAG